MNYQELTPIVVALLGGGGIWGYLSTRSKNNHELKVKEKDTSAEFQDNLKERVKAVSNENKELHKKVEELQEKLMEVSIQLAAGQEKIKHLESEIKLYELRLKAEADKS